MSTIKPQINVQYTANIELRECELRAIDAMVGYGADAFLKVFYEKLGTNYMRDHESGLRALFEKITAHVPGQLRLVDSARAALTKEGTGI